MENTLQNWT